ncbi:hypothetical protein F3Y22_tig00116951pilonHSYRG00874 [Hibiscus syriacus]|uniref:Desiccation-related protein PCC13-62 n=1 Tax=Hibiscus syriacus TaxID=106335 RepID=A0A6A2X180_HIBSY|nr:hypothetical protein F3Y22_tig00116951pilonHSYRG00874 [Hibiscus syriacus]
MDTPSFYSAIILFLLPLQLIAVPSCPRDCEPIDATDKNRVHFAYNLEFPETEWFLCGTHGRGLDAFEPEFAKGGPPPIGCKKANLDHLTHRVMEEFGYQEIGHLRAIRTTVDGIKYLLGTYCIPYVGLNGYVGTIPCLKKFATKKLVAGLMGVESGQDATVRAWLYRIANYNVEPYNITVNEFTTRISELRNKLGHCGIKDEGLMVPPELGAENRTSSNVLSADYNSLSYPRTPAEIVRIVYGTGDEHKPGGFFPEGANGRIAREYLYNDKLKVL